MSSRTYSTPDAPVPRCESVTMVYFDEMCEMDFDAVDKFFEQEVPMRGRMLPFVQPTAPQCAYMEDLYPLDLGPTAVRKGELRVGDYRRLAKETDFECMEYLAFEQAWMAEEAKRKGK